MECNSGQTPKKLKKTKQNSWCQVVSDQAPLQKQRREFETWNLFSLLFTSVTTPRSVFSRLKEQTDKLELLHFCPCFRDVKKHLSVNKFLINRWHHSSSIWRRFWPWTRPKWRHNYQLLQQWWSKMNYNNAKAAKASRVCCCRLFRSYLFRVSPFEALNFRDTTCARFVDLKFTPS